VASLSDDYDVSFFSNYGKKTVHILAPGNEIYSLYPNNSYKMNAGTSMAAPHVSGVAALIYSVCCIQRYMPEATEVIDIVSRTSVKVDTAKKTVHGAYINAEAAVLTTLMGGLWMQINCDHSKVQLGKNQKKHIPIVFSGYKNGIYKTNIILGITPVDKDSEVYGEIVIPIRIVTDVKYPNFVASPRFGKPMSINKDEAPNDELLDYMCNNSLYDIQKITQRNTNIVSIILLLSSICCVGLICFGIVKILQNMFSIINKNLNKNKRQNQNNNEQTAILTNAFNKMDNLFCHGQKEHVNKNNVNTSV
ncbi:subtilisin-like protease 2, putative, partial [Hepatocystis sp. ex Piliocolobus tephrosceles]